MQVITSPYAAARAAAAAPAAAAGRDLARAAQALEQYEVGRVKMARWGWGLHRPMADCCSRPFAEANIPSARVAHCRTRGLRCLGLAPATCRSSSASSQRPETSHRQGRRDGHGQQALVPSCAPPAACWLVVAEVGLLMVGLTDCSSCLCPCHPQFGTFGEAASVNWIHIQYQVGALWPCRPSCLRGCGCRVTLGWRHNA